MKELHLSRQLRGLDKLLSTLTLLDDLPTQLEVEIALLTYFIDTKYVNEASKIENDTKLKLKLKSKLKLETEIS